MKCCSLETVQTFGKWQSGVTNTRSVTALHSTAHRYFTLLVECGQAECTKLLISVFLIKGQRGQKCLISLDGKENVPPHGLVGGQQSFKFSNCVF
jgi:hypothetical protein